jgi:hypothetical protein
MLDDRDYMRRPSEEPTPEKALRSVWSAFIERLRWLFRYCWPTKTSAPPVESRKSKAEFSTDEFFKNEVDPILEKISAKGIQSLTVKERETLENARAKMQRR